MGLNPNGTTALNTFDFKCYGKHPSIKTLIEAADKLYPHVRDKLLVAVTELSSEDWEDFISKQ